MECWKDIDDFKGLYQVSSEGRVRSLDRMIYDEKNNRKYLLSGKIMNLYDNGNGYLVVHLRKNNKRYVKYIHRLVAKEFLSDYNEKQTVNHKDFNKKNNDINNLECCSLQENLKYSYVNDRYKNASSKRVDKILIKTNEKKKRLANQIIKLRLLGMSIEKIAKNVHLKYEYVNEILLENNISKPNVKIQCIETNEVFETIKEANDKYGVTTIKDSISGRQKTSAGMHWKKIILE